jgi:cell division protein FtsW (lipid II flippase)
VTDNPNKKSLWDKIHIDPAMLLILLALLVYSAMVIWSASGQDLGMTERKIGQITMGLVVMVVMAQIPGALSLYLLYHSTGGGGCLWRHLERRTALARSRYCAFSAL